MVVEPGFNKPSNRIVAYGEPFVRNLYVELGTDCYPGRLVKSGTNQNDIKAQDTSGNAVAGWLGYEQAAMNYRPATVSTAYATGDFAPVLNGPGMVIKATLEINQTITRDEALAIGGGNTAGSVVSATIGTDMPVAIALEDVTTTSAAKDIWVMSLI